MPRTADQPQSPDSRIYKGAAAVAVPTNESLVLLVDDKLLRLKRSYAPRSRVHQLAGSMLHLAGGSLAMLVLRTDPPSPRASGWLDGDHVLMHSMMP